MTRHVVNLNGWKPGDKPRKGVTRPLLVADIEQRKTDEVEDRAARQEDETRQRREEAAKRVMDRLVDEELTRGGI